MHLNDAPVRDEQGLRFTTATNAAILEACIPVYATVIGWVFGVESCGRGGCRKMWQKIGGIFLASAGAIFVIVTSDRGHAHIAHHPNSTKLFGNVLLWTSTVLLAAYMQVQTPLARVYNAIRLTAFSQCVCVMFSSVAGLVTVAFSEFENHAQWAAWRPESTFWYCLAYAVVSITIVNFTVETWAIHRSSATTCAIFMCLEPPMTICFSSLILKEGCRPITFIGGAVIITGLLLNLSAAGDESSSAAPHRGGGGSSGGGRSEFNGEYDGCGYSSGGYGAGRRADASRSGGGVAYNAAAPYDPAAAAGVFIRSAEGSSVHGDERRGSRRSSTGEARDPTIIALFGGDADTEWEPAGAVAGPALHAETADFDAVGLFYLPLHFVRILLTI